jgi:hypothetical protein
LWHVTRNPGRDLAFARLLLIASAVYYIGTALLRMWRYSGGVDLSDALMNPGASYYRRRELGLDLFQGEDRVKTLENLFYFLAAFCPIVVVAMWERLRWWIRGICLGAMGIHIMSFIATGTNKGIGDVLILAFAGALLRFQKNASRGSEDRRRWVKRLFVLVAAILGFVYLSYTLLDRQVARGAYGEEAIYSGLFDGQEAGGITTPVLKTVMGERLGYGADTLVNWYMTHGYLGLGFCLEMPFQWTFGIGNSWAAMDIAQQFFGISDVWERTFLYRAEGVYGWRSLGWWSTMYAWYGSDLSWPGVVVLMMVFGRLVANVWFRARVRSDVVAMALFGQLMIQMIYITANNQLLHMRGGLVSTFVLMVWYFAKGGRGGSKRLI